jgi:hypothetical protein
MTVARLDYGANRAAPTLRAPVYSSRDAALSPRFGTVVDGAGRTPRPTESPHVRRREPMPGLRRRTTGEHPGGPLPPLPDVPGDAILRAITSDAARFGLIDRILVKVVRFAIVGPKRANLR